MEVASSNLNPEVKEDKKVLEKIKRQKVALRCPFPGLDIVHTTLDNGLAEMSFNIKFKMLKGEHEAVKELVDFPVPTPETPVPEEQTLVAVVTADESDSADPVELDDQLVYTKEGEQAEIYKIVSVDEENREATIVKYIPPPGEPITISLSEARTGINTYLLRN